VTVDYDLAVKRWLRESSLDVEAEMADLVTRLRTFREIVEPSPKSEPVDRS
jgi:hypothetical protein